ncbi:ATP-binding protein [bacterium]
MFKKRKLEENIKPYLNHKNAIVITGARQVGKTTLLRNIYKAFPEEQKLWFDLENPLHQKYFESIDYDEIYKQLIDLGLKANKKKYIFIDEIQTYPQITKIIKYLIDHYKVKFFLTGSSSFYMKNLFPESLTGRKFVFNLYPLDFHEFLFFKGFAKDVYSKSELDLSKKSFVNFKKHSYEFEEFMTFGGFPEVVLAKSHDEKKLILENIFKSFFEKDILQLADYQDVREIRDLILLLSRRVGSKLDITRIAGELGVNRYKVYSYLEFLQATFLVNLVSMYTKSIDKKVAGGKKVYFIDNGLLNEIVKIDDGQMFENCIANLLARYGELAYYQTKGTKEIDFILNKEVAFEVKVKAMKKDKQMLDKVSSELNIEKSFIISKEFVEDIDNMVYPQFL